MTLFCSEERNCGDCETLCKNADTVKTKFFHQCPLSMDTWRVKCCTVIVAAAFLIQFVSHTATEILLGSDSVTSNPQPIELEL